jgi:hypothetical protein
MFYAIGNMSADWPRLLKHEQGTGKAVVEPARSSFIFT